MDHLSVHCTLHNSIFIVLTVLCVQIHCVLDPSGVRSVKSIELRVEDVIVHLMVTIHFGDSMTAIPNSNGTPTYESRRNDRIVLPRGYQSFWLLISHV